MIENFEQKEYTENQIRRLENVLMSLRDKLMPKREKQYKLMAAFYVRKIREMREEIDEYTGLEMFNIKKDDINIHIEGPAIRYGSAPISIISGFLGNFRKTLQKFYITLNNLNYKTRIPKSIAALSDFELNAFQPGSINLSLSLPNNQISIFDMEKSVKTYFDILKWAYYDNDEFINDIKKEIKEKLLVNIIRTLPDDKNISTITFSGKMLDLGKDKKIIINRKSKEKIIDTINNSNNNLKMISMKGCIRELDLDRWTFELRNIEGDSKFDQKCKINSEIVDDLKEYLDSVVAINGYKYGNILKVKYIEQIE